MANTLTFGTRPSALARWQTEYVIGLLERAWPEIDCVVEVIDTKGDRLLDKPLPEIGGKGLFTYELEEALRAGRIDAAVHSLKDLPTEDSPGLTIGAVPERANALDAWVCPSGKTLETLPPGALVGTSSNRRRAQILSHRPDLKVQSIRGNVDTRLRKAREGQFDALVLAAAGLSRLGLEEHIVEILPVTIMLPAPGQGALAVQCRVGDSPVVGYLAPIEDRSTRREVTAERGFLYKLGGGCSLPVGAFAITNNDKISLSALVLSHEGDERIEISGEGVEPLQLGMALAQEALSQGADELLTGVAG